MGQENRAALVAERVQLKAELQSKEVRTLAGRVRCTRSVTSVVRVDDEAGAQLSEASAACHGTGGTAGVITYCTVWRPLAALAKIARRVAKHKT